MSHTHHNSKVSKTAEVAPTEQSSTLSYISSSSIVNDCQNNSSQNDKKFSPCDNIAIAQCSTSEPQPVESKENDTACAVIRRRVPIGEKLSQEIEELKVEIMPPNYGGVYTVNAMDDIEGGNNNSCYLSDDDRSETAMLLPKTNNDNSRNRPQQTDNETTGKSSNNTMALPKDTYNFVYVVFFLLGLSTLLPWNFFISITQFWDYRFRDVNATDFIYFVVGGNSSSKALDGNQTELQKEFTSYLSIASNVPNAIFVILNAIYGARISIRKRLTVSGSVIIVLFMGITVLAKTNSDTWQTEFLYVVLTLVVLINIFAATFQSGVFGVAGKFPPQYMGSCMVGQAFGGVFPAIVDILVVAINIEPQNEGFACLLIATLSLLLSFLAFIGTRYSTFFRYYAGEDGARELLINEESAVNNDSDDTDSVPTNITAFDRLKHVQKNSWEYCLAVFLTFTITLCLWPSVAVLVESQFKNSKTRSTWANDYFTPVSVFLLFNVGDLIGRSIANVVQLPGINKRGKLIVLVLSLLRAIFIPLFIFCNASPENRTLPVIFSSDADFIIITTIFALSNGYLGNICMLHGPKTVEDSVLQEETAMVLVACLVIGTGSGSFLSYPIIQIL